MYKVYWTDIKGKSHGQNHKTINELLAHASSLRKRTDLSFIVTVGEDSNCVSLPGVSDPPSNYNWKKRRL